MSRYTFVKEDGNTVAYGFDHLVGYFYQEFEPNIDEPIKDVDSVFGGLTGVKLAVMVAGNAPYHYLSKMYLDLEF